MFSCVPETVEIVCCRTSGIRSRSSCRHTVILSTPYFTAQGLAPCFWSWKTTISTQPQHSREPDDTVKAFACLNHRSQYHQTADSGGRQVDDERSADSTCSSGSCRSAGSFQLLWISVDMLWSYGCVDADPYTCTLLLWSMSAITICMHWLQMRIIRRCQFLTSAHLSRQGQLWHVLSCNVHTWLSNLAGLQGCIQGRVHAL